MNFEIEPLSAPMGAIVRGWEPDKSLTPIQRDLIADALQEHLVLIFRGQRQPTDEELIAFAGAFGDLLKGSAFLERARGHPEILHVGNLVGDDGKPLGTGGANMMDWHADYSYVDVVGRETFLNAVTLPKTPPHTYFSNQYHAFETLSEPTKRMLRGLRAFHSVSHYYQEGGSKDVERFKADQQRDRAQGVARAAIPEAEHPVVVRHPRTGREILYVGQAITRCILGLSPEESSAMLLELYAHSTRPDNILAHDWELGDLVMFDTLGTLHKRDAWDPGETRLMRQLSTVCRID